jgi:DNA-3-methyladenine glycosylase II
MIKTLDENNLIVACAELSKRDADLAAVFQTYGVPPLWAREEGFATLLHIILEQQVSVASALSAFNKLREKLNGAITPENLLSLTDAEMKACYFSRQKTVYARELAAAIAGGNLDLESFAKLTDEQIKTELKRIKGIGDWTADIYLLMAMRRPDVMPRGDLALHVAWQKLKRLERRPAADEFLEVAERWKPLRAVAARLLWHFYLSAKKIQPQRIPRTGREKEIKRR